MKLRFVLRIFSKLRKATKYYGFDACAAIYEAPLHTRIIIRSAKLSYVDRAIFHGECVPMHWAIIEQREGKYGPKSKVKAKQKILHINQIQTLNNEYNLHFEIS